MASIASDVDDLFQLPLTEFTAARNALAAKLKAAGRSEAAAYVKGLAKPPLSAWVVNQLFWRHREAFDRLLTTGERLRTVQASHLRGKGGNLREALEARRKALAELTKRATAMLRTNGPNPTPDLMRRITTTLEALATYGRQASAPRAGHLTDDVSPPGFEALAALVPRRGGAARGSAAPRVLPFQQRGKTVGKRLDPEARRREKEEERQARIAAATEALRAAERAVAEARKVAARAEAALKKAAALAKHAERKKDALAGKLEKVTTDADKARHEARRVAAEAEEAAQAVEDAERALDEARRRRESLD